MSGFIKTGFNRINKIVNRRRMARDRIKSCARSPLSNFIDLIKPGKKRK